MKKRIFTALLAMLIIITAIPIAAHASDAPEVKASGTDASFLSGARPSARCALITQKSQGIMSCSIIPITALVFALMMTDTFMLRNAELNPDIQGSHISRSPLQTLQF